MRATTLTVATPEGDGGHILTRAEDYIFRNGEETNPRAAISLLMLVRTEGFCCRELHPIFR